MSKTRFWRRREGPRCLKHRWLRYGLTAALAIIATGWLCRGLILQSLADFLTVSERFDSADSVVILGGRDAYGQAADWLAEGSVSRMITYDRRPSRLVRRGLLPSHRDNTFRQLREAGIPENRLWNLAEPVEGTDDLLEVLGERLASRSGQRIVVLCDQWDSRRIRMKINRNVSDELAQRFHVVESPRAETDSSNWWRSSLGRRLVIQRWAQLLALIVASDEKQEWKERSLQELHRAAVGG